MLTFCEDSLLLRGIGMIQAMGIPIKQPLYRSFGSSNGALGSTLCLIHGPQHMAPWHSYMLQNLKLLDRFRWSWFDRSRFATLQRCNRNCTEDTDAVYRYYIGILYKD